MVHVIVDLEMNPLGKGFEKEKEICRNEIIEIGAVALDEQYNEIGNFMTFVKPQMNAVIEKKIETLTGISTEKVEGSPGFEKAAEMFFNWCQGFPGEIEIVQWSDSDHTQFTREAQLKGYRLTREQSRLLEGWKDLQGEYNEKLGLGNQVSLKNALMYAGLDFDGSEHDALYDARNTARLLMVIRTPELCEKALGAAIEALKPKSVGSSLGELFDFNELFRRV